MTPLLQKAFDRAARLPSEVQDRIGAQILGELDGDGEWDRVFAHPKSEAVLNKLAEAALKNHREGKVGEGGFGGK